jgi:hypothetical protein
MVEEAVSACGDLSAGCRDSLTAAVVAIAKAGAAIDALKEYCVAIGAWIWAIGITLIVVVVTVRPRDCVCHRHIVAAFLRVAELLNFDIAIRIHISEVIVVQPKRIAHEWIVAWNLRQQSSIYCRLRHIVRSDRKYRIASLVVQPRRLSICVCFFNNCSTPQASDLDFQIGFAPSRIVAVALLRRRHAWVASALNIGSEHATQLRAVVSARHISARSIREAATPARALTRIRFAAAASDPLAHSNTPEPTTLMYAPCGEST